MHDKEMPDMMTMDPYAEAARLHDEMDRRERVRDRQRDYDASETVRDCRALDYLGRTLWSEMNDRQRAEHRLIAFIFAAAVLGFVVWVFIVLRVLF